MTFPTSLHIRERGAVHDPDLSLDTHLSPLWPQDSFHDTPKSSEEILHAILNTRKSWKTLKGQAEAVWPPYLEATMLKALQEYVPEDTRETRILGRFPMRNRFISDYIYRATGKYRSAKQVGSRLQQLRDTVEGREMIDSLTRCYRAPTRPQSAADHICSSNARTLVCHTSSPLLADDPFLYTISTEGSSDSCSTSSSSSEDLSLSSLLVPPPERNLDLVMSPSSSALKHPQTADSRTPVYIDILPEHSQSRWVSSASPPHSSASSSVPPTSPQAPSHSGSARRMRDIDPIVTFVSPTPINGKSSYIVLLDGAPIHSEDTKLVCVGPYVSSASAPSRSPSSTGSTHGGPVLYNTALVPKYWDILSKAANPTLYTIIQDVYRAPDLGAASSHYAGGIPPAQSSRPRPVKIFSAVYHFRYSPNVISGGGYPSYSSPPSNPGPGYSLSPSSLSSLSLSPMLTLKPGLGSIGHNSSMTPTSFSGAPAPSMGAGQYGMQQQLHPGYMGAGQHRHGHLQGHTGYTYGAYPPTTASGSSSTYHTSSMTSSEALMHLREEDFFRFDDAESPTPSSSGGTGSIASGSAVQSPPSFFPKDMNSYF